MGKSYLNGVVNFKVCSNDPPPLSYTEEIFRFMKLTQWNDL